MTEAIGRTLLYIDPDPAIQLLLRTVLTPEGFVVCPAKSALEGQLLAACTPPDLVLVDVDLVKAAEVVPALRQSPGLEQVRLLASTSCAGTEHFEKMLAWGFDRILLKPIDVDTLARELERALAPAEAVVRGRDTAHVHGTPPVASAALGAVREVPTAAVARDAPGAGRAAVAGPLDSPSAGADVGTSLDAVGPVEADPLNAPGASRAEGDAEPRILEPAPSAGSTVPPESPAVPVDTDAREAPLDPVDVPPLWRLSLTPGIEALASASGSAEGVLALLDEASGALVVMATTPDRRAVHAGAPDSAALGTRVRATAVPWIEPALERRRAIVVANAGAPSALARAGSHPLLVVPVASPERVYGVAVLARRRGSKAAAFSAGHMARSLAQASRIAGIVRALEDLDRTTGEKRRELERLRLEGARAVLTEMVEAAKPSRRGGAGRERAQAEPGRDADQRARVIRLGVALAERLGVPPRRREILRQALEVHDIGKAWLEDVLVPRTAFAPLGRAAPAHTYARHGAEILASLDWPPPVVELVRMHLAWWNGEGQPAGLSGTRIPMEARIMAVVVAFAQLTRAAADGATEVDRAIAELTRQAGQRFDPSVVEALAAVVASDGRGRDDGRA